MDKNSDMYKENNVPPPKKKQPFNKYRGIMNFRRGLIFLDFVGTLSQWNTKFIKCFKRQKSYPRNYIPLKLENFGHPQKLAP